MILLKSEVIKYVRNRINTQKDDARSGINTGPTEVRTQYGTRLAHMRSSELSLPHTPLSHSNAFEMQLGRRFTRRL